MAGMTWARRALATTVLAALGAMVALVPTASAHTVPPSPDASFIGTWTNVDASTFSIKQIVITSAGEGGGLLVDAFGACTPTLCEFGQVPAVVFGPSVSATTGGRTFETNQTYEGTLGAVLIGRLQPAHGGPHLAVDEYTTFNDATGRHNLSATDHFVKGGDETVTQTGVAATTYPGALQPATPNALLGTWINTEPGGGNILEFDISRAGDGTLLVHEWGNCTPTPCDNGTVGAIAYGHSVGAANGGRLLIPFEYGFARELDQAALSGHTLKVRELFELLDTRSNFTVDETFTKAPAT